MSNGLPKMHQWVYLQASLTGEKQIGPISETEFISLLKKGKISKKTKVASTTRTKGRWLLARQVSGIQNLLSRLEKEKYELSQRQNEQPSKLQTVLHEERNNGPAEPELMKPAVPKANTPPPLANLKAVSIRLNERQSVLSWVAMVGLLLLCISPFLTWVKFGVLAVTGIAGDGKILLFIGSIALISFSFVAFKKTWLSLIVLPVQAFGIVCTLWLGAILLSISSQNIPAAENVLFAALLPSSGVGLWLGISGGILLAGSAGLLAYECLSKVSKVTHFFVTEAAGIVLGLTIAIALTGFPDKETLPDASVAPPSPFSFGSSTNQPEKLKEEVAKVPYREIFSKDNVAVQLTMIELKKPQVEDMFGNLNLAKDVALVISISFTNLDDRKILRFQRSNSFGPSKFTLKDDAGNIIRGIDYGLGAKIPGSLDGTEDINPGSITSHVEVFMVPPPKTKSLFLAIDLDCVGRAGAAEFEIPSEVVFN